MMSNRCLDVHNIPATKLFLTKSSRVLSPKNTSASSMSKIESHRLARVKFSSSASSTSRAVDPRSPIIN